MLNQKLQASHLYPNNKKDLNKSNKDVYREYDAWLREFAATTANCTYLDVTANVPLARKDIYIEDNVHFNPEGYRLYADFFREALKDELARY